MELLYFWYLDDRKTIKEQGFTFSPKYRFFADLEKEKKNLNVFIELKDDFIKDFFSEQTNLVSDNLQNNTTTSAEIINVTAIIGENGTGKTNLLHLLIHLLSSFQYTGYFPTNSEYVVAFWNNDKIEIFYYLPEINLRIKKSQDIENIKITEIEKNNQQPVASRKPIATTYRIPRTKVIYFNPAFDFRDYPSKIANKNKTYIDLSTNSLIQEDTLNEDLLNSEQFIPENYDKVWQHKCSNTFRFFELANSNIANLGKIKIPDDVEIHFDCNYFDFNKEEIYLKPESIKIFKFLDELITPTHKKVNSIAQQSPDDESFLKEKFKVKFSYFLLHNYFLNLNFESNIDIGVKKEFLLSNDRIFETFLDFFQKQKFANSLDLLYSNVLTSIDNCSGINEKFFKIDNINAVEIFSSYVSYLNSFVNPYVVNFLHVNWRNISSGEKSLLDLYSRLYNAKKRIEREEENSKIEFLYLLIDEGDLGLHSQWQKEYINELLNFISICFANKKTQLILTSHSPIILSDLPKNNIIFIEKHKKGLLKVVDIDRKETFASNIHSLFSNSFFIKDELIGTFAKDKINTIIGLLKKADKNGMSTFVVTIFWRQLITFVLWQKNMITILK